MKVFVVRPIPESGIAMMRQAGLTVEIQPKDRPAKPEEVSAGAPGADAVIAMLSTPINAAFFDMAPSVKIVANYAVGTNNIDIPEASRRGVAIANTPDVLTDATADLAWALILATARRIVEADDYVRTGKWDGWGPKQFLGLAVAGATIGIVGPGRIGGAIARRAHGFGMRILYCGPSRKEHLERDYGAQRRELKDLLAESDYISLSCPLTSETKHLIGREELALMKPSAILVNTARGPVIDEPALVEALREKRIAGAGLDVYEKEPVLQSGLFELRNVVLLPHIGSSTIGTRERMSELCAENIIAFFKGERPPTIMNPEVLC